MTNITNKAPMLYLINYEKDKDILGELKSCKLSKHLRKEGYRVLVTFTDGTECKLYFPDLYDASNFMEELSKDNYSFDVEEWQDKD